MAFVLFAAICPQSLRFIGEDGMVIFVEGIFPAVFYGFSLVVGYRFGRFLVYRKFIWDTTLQFANLPISVFAFILQGFNEFFSKR